MLKTNSKLKKITTITAISALTLFAGCNTTQLSENTDNGNKVPTITGSFYPVSEIAKAIGQDTIKVNTIIPIGAEPHSFEPTAKQIVELSKSDAIITMEGMFENIEDKIIDSNKEIRIIDAAHNLELVEITEGEHNHEEHADEHHEKEEHGHEDEHADEHHEEEEHGHEDETHTADDGHDHDHGDFDPHTWLSIHNMEKMTEEISEQLIEMYPENKELYEINKVKYLTKLTELENKFEQELSTCAKDVILVNHKAFGYLAHEYNFEQISASGFSPESEPSPKTIQNVINEAKEHNLKVIFSEGQMDKKTAETLASEIDGQVLELNPILTDEKDYFELMEKNLENLKTGLECK